MRSSGSGYCGGRPVYKQTTRGEPCDDLQQARHIYPVFEQCWPNVAGSWPTLVKHWADVSCLLGITVLFSQLIPYITCIYKHTYFVEIVLWNAIFKHTYFVAIVLWNAIFNRAVYSSIKVIVKNGYTTQIIQETQCTQDVIWYGNNHS